MSDCIFCKIIRNEIPSPRIYEDDSTIVIRDIQPQAPKHFLVIPKHHVRSVAAAFSNTEDGERLMGQLYRAVQRVVESEGLLPGGYRTVVNTESDGGQTVFHLHLHLLGGGRLKGSFA